uniref:Dehydrogenase/reductase 13 n=1 Tax=Lates calcarifer TaxID=8187 RepID=A0A4W6DEW2_LATCA
MTVLKLPRCTAATKLHGKTVIVTGANTGIGKTTAIDLARRGARVILACRDKGRGEAAVQEIIQETGNKQVIFMQLDLASLKSVRSFVDNFLKSEPRLDILINNAGQVCAQTVEKTEDGFGMMFRCQPPWSLPADGFAPGPAEGERAEPCCDRGLQSPRDGKSGFQLSDDSQRFGSGNSDYEIFQDYCHSKLCNVLFTYELAKRLEGTEVTCYSLHPGVIKTEIGRYASFWWTLFLRPFVLFFSVDAESGAQTTLHCALEQGIEHLSGHYFTCCAPVLKINPKARDDAVAKKLWELSESFCGLS